MGRFWLFIVVVATLSLSDGAVERNDTLCSIARRTKDAVVPAECDWHYIAYFPRIFRTGTWENVAVLTHGFDGNVAVTVEFVDKQGEKIEGTQTATSDGVLPDKLTLLPLLVNHQTRDNVRIRVSGVSVDGRWKFSNTSKDMSVEKLGLNLFIQTDRPLYKPGEKIRLRVLSVDTKLKPSETPIDQVVIENPQGSRMRQWSNVTLDEGFASLFLQLSVKPVLGDWKIKVTTKGYKKELTIEVKKYVLPKFQVTVTPPSYLVKTMKSIDFKVCAKYSYGKNVVGKLSTAICLTQSTNYLYQSLKSPPRCIDIFKQVDGCHEFTIETDDLGLYANDSHYYYTRKFTINASVKETVTGLTMKAEQSRMTVLDNDVKLSFTKDDIFKPGFALNVQLLAKRPDDSDIDKLLVDVKVESDGVPKPLLEKKIAVVGGKANIRIESVPFNAQNVRLKATYRRTKLFDNEPDYKRLSTAYMNMKPWYSPSHSYLKIEAPSKPFKIGDLSDIKVRYTSVDREDVDRTVYYSMMCAGNVAAFGHVTATFKGASPRIVKETTKTTAAPTKPSVVDDEELVLKRVHPWWWGGGEFVTRPPLPAHFSTGHFSLRQQITKNMLPSCRLVIYYIRDEETVADNVDIDVVDEFENNVKIEFSDKEVIPGASATLKVTGAANSRFAITAIDKSITFLAKNNDLKEKQLLDIREQLDISPGYVSEGKRCGGYDYWPRGQFGGRRRRSIYFGDASDYVDSEKAFVHSGLRVMSSLRLDSRPCTKTDLRIDSVAIDSIGYGGGGGGVMFKGSVDSNANNEGKKVEQGGTKPKAKAARPRQDFPETWLWTDERLSANGEKELRVKVPDTITTWVANGFAINKEQGLGVAAPAEIRGFQPFFLSLNLPYSVIRGEEVQVPAAVFSYLSRSVCLTIKVSLAYSKEYRMVAGPSGKSCLCGGKTMKVLFRIKPKKIGKIALKISAETMPDNVCSFNRNKFDGSVTASDAIIKQLRVTPEGEPKEFTHSSFFCTKAGQKVPHQDGVDLNQPENLVPGSVYTKVTVIGDIMGPSLSSMDEVLAMPYGCGEQNMLKFAPNIFIMNYLRNTDQVTEEIKTKAIDYMLSGYQRELTYKHIDGSYSAFGERSGEDGSTWLTAFVLKSFSQARAWIDIDEREIEQSKKWFLNEERTDSATGCFRKLGSLHNKAMQGGVDTPVTLTAYVLISLLESDSEITSNRHFTDAAACVSQRLDDVKDSYSLSIIAYMFAKMKNTEKYTDVMKTLDGMAIVEGQFKHWEAPETNDIPRYWWANQARSSDIEQTSYALLAVLEMEGTTETGLTKAVSIVRWLSKQRNSLGGWASTQDTVLAMQALASFAELAFSSQDDHQMTINVEAKHGLPMKPRFNHEFRINKQNALVLQRAEGISIPSKVKISASGTGCALIQVTMKYNVRKAVRKPMFELTHAITSVSTVLTAGMTCASQNLRICSRYLGQEDSNMALKEVQLISGFGVDQESIDEQLKKVVGLKDIELKENKVVMYFNKLTDQYTCVDLLMVQESPVEKTLPAFIRVYDYYDTNKEAELTYNFSEKQCSGKKGKGKRKNVRA